MYDLNITSSNADIQAESVRQMGMSLETAAELGARVVVVHPGRVSSSRDNAADYWWLLCSVVSQLDMLAAKYDLVVGSELMEQRSKEIFVTPEDAGRLMCQGWDHVGLTVDIAHFQTFGDASQLLATIPPHWITHVHLSDGAPGATHLPLGWGQLDISAALGVLAGWYSGLVTLEGYAQGRGEEVLAGNIAFLQALGYAHQPLPEPVNGYVPA